jgi:hypothetical protein
MKKKIKATFEKKIKATFEKKIKATFEKKINQQQNFSELNSEQFFAY